MDFFYLFNGRNLFKIIFLMIISLSVTISSFYCNQHDIDFHIAQVQYEHENIDDPLDYEIHFHTHSHGPGEQEHTHEHSHGGPSINGFDVKVVSFNQSFVISPGVLRAISCPLEKIPVLQNISRSIFRPPIT